MGKTPDSRFFCSLLSRESSEQTFGTASVADVWFILEYAPWPGEGLAESKLPDQVKTHLIDLLGGIPRSSLLFVKQDHNFQAPFSFFVVLTSESRPVSYRFTLEEYADILSLDVPSIVNENPKYEGNKHREKMYLVCTDGNHDKCCAKFGIPVYQEANRLEGDSTWQSSHIGGDRFAPNLVCFPSGVYYGQLDVPEVECVLDYSRNESVYLEKYRGRSCYEFIPQAAEYLLRKRLNQENLFAFEMRESENIRDKTWKIEFDSRYTKEKHILKVERYESEFQNQLSCRSSRESTVPQYRLISHKSVRPSE